MAAAPPGMAGPSKGDPMAASAGIPNGKDPRDELPTFIYDFFLKNKKPEMAQKMLEHFQVKTTSRTKTSPSSREINGVDNSSGQDTKDPTTKQIEGLPLADLAAHSPMMSESSFLQDWWALFWDVWAVGKSTKANPMAQQYMNFQRNNQRSDPAGRTNPAVPFINGVRLPNGMVNGINPAEMRRGAVMNNRNMTQGRNFSQGQTQLGQNRESSSIDPSASGRPPSPMSSDNAPSPSKRARISESDMYGGQAMGPGGRSTSMGPQMARPGGPNAPQVANGFEAGILGHGQFQNIQNGGRAIGAFANNGMLGNDMTGVEMFTTGANTAAHYQRNPGPGNQATNQGGALADYQMQLMLLEQQNKRRLLMARQEQDVNTQPGGVQNINSQMPIGQSAFPPGVSPNNVRNGLSPGNGQVRRGTPTMQGSPHPEGPMPVTRGSPAPGLDPSQMGHNMAHFMGQPGAQNGMLMRPNGPFGGPGAPMNAQVEMMKRTASGQQANVPPGAQGPPQNPNDPNQPRGKMPPPGVPQSNANVQHQPSPSQQPAAPPTPGNKANNAKAKKDTKETKKKPQKKGTTATPSSEAEQPPTPTPATPITPVAHDNPFKSKTNPGQATTSTGDNPANSSTSQDASAQEALSNQTIGNDFADFNMDFTNMNDNNDVLDGFDFDSFLHMDGQQAGTFDMDPSQFNFGTDGVEMGTGGS